MKRKLMLGTKLFRYIESEDDFEIIRVIRVYNNNKVKIRNETIIDAEDIKVEEDVLAQQGYSILESVGVMSFSIVDIGKNKDVVITLMRNMDAKLGSPVPCVICRQSVTDFFYTLLSQEKEHGYVGVSASDKTCPTNIDYGTLLACDDITYSDVMNIYYDDTVDSVLECVNKPKFDEVLCGLFDKHAEATGNPLIKFRKSDHGWCKNIRDLMISNNFWTDVDAAYNITQVNFNIPDYLIRKEDENKVPYSSFNEEATLFLSKTFELNIVDTIVVPYGYDIDLAEYNNSNYVLIRNNNGELYLVVYLTEGVYLEQDIVAKKEKEDISHTLGLYIYNKYTEQSQK